MTVSSDGVIVLADVRTGTRKTVRTESSLLGVVAVGDRMITFNRWGASIRNTTTARFLLSLDPVGEFQQLAVSERGDVLAACVNLHWESVGRTTIWDASAGRVLTTFREADEENTTATVQAMPCSVAVGEPRPPVQRIAA